MHLPAAGRYLALAVTFCGLILAVILLIRTVGAVKLKEEEQNIMDYQMNVLSSYGVALMDSRYLKEDVMGMDETYISKIVDQIQVCFQLDYTGDDTASLQGAYEVTTSLRGYQSLDGEKQVLWEVLTDDTGMQEINTNKQMYNRKEELHIAYNDYKLEAQLATEELGITASTEILVQLTGTCSVEKDGIAQEIPFQQEVIIPITEGLFTIEHTEEERLSNHLANQVEVIEPIDRRRVAVILVTMVVLLGMGLFLLLMVRTCTPEELKHKREEKLLREYKSRLIELSTMPQQKWKESFCVSSMDELLKLSEELRRPILYIRHAEDDTSCFFLVDEDRKYILS